MKKILFLLTTLLISVACSPSNIVTPNSAPPVPEAAQDETSDGSSIQQASGGNDFAETSDLAGDSSYYYGGSMFEDTVFDLATTLPEIGETTTLLQRPYPDFSQGNGISLEEARAIAAQLGFSGTLYEEQIQLFDYGEDRIEAEFAVPEYPRLLVAFNGNQRLTFHETGFSLGVESVEIAYRPLTADSLLPLDQLTQKAETLLRDAQLLDRDYVAKRGWGNNIQFLPIVDGHSLQSPFASVEFDQNGEFLFMDYNQMPLPTEYEQETAVSAQAAFDLLLENPDRFSYDFVQFDQPYDEGIPFPEPNNWQRDIIDGQPYTLQMWLNVFQPVDGNGSPLIFGNNYQMTGDEAMLSELAQTPNPINVRGIPSTDNNKRMFAVESWTQADMLEEPYVQGIVDRQPDAVWLDTDGGRRLRVLDAPDELITGMEVGMEFWSLENDEINWSHMFENSFEQPPEIDPIPVEEPWEPTKIESVTFSEIEQTYSYFYRGFEVEPVFSGDGEEIALEWPIDEGERFAIHWVFKGVTNEGRDITFYVPAIELPPEPDYANYGEQPPAIQVFPEPVLEPDME